MHRHCFQIRYLGGKLGTELAKEYDAKTVGEMHKIALGATAALLLLSVSTDNTTKEEMQNKFGESSIWVYEILRYVSHIRYNISSQ